MINTLVKLAHENAKAKGWWEAVRKFRRSRMKLTLAFEIMNRIAKCPVCGSNKIGGGAGSIDIDGNEIKRSCACGMIMTITHEEGDAE